MNRPSQPLAIAALAVAVVSMSSSVIFMRWSTLHPADLAAYRLLGGALVLLPLFVSGWRHHRIDHSPRIFFHCIVPGIVLGFHFLIWVQGSRMTPATNAILAVNTGPIILPFLLFFLVGERVTSREIFGTLIALAGLAVLATTDFDSDPAYFRGDLVCLSAMFFLALYMALARKNSPRFPANRLYAVPVYTVAALTCFLARFFTGGVPELPRGDDWWWVLCLIIFPTLLGHGLLLYSLRSLRGQLVGVSSLCQFISAGIFAFFAFAEIPTLGFVIASLFIITGAAIIIFTKKKPAQKP